MTNSYIAVKGERLDIIVKKVLGNLNEFENVLKNNPHLQDKIFLDHDDIVSFKALVKKEFLVTIKESKTADNDAIGIVSQNNIQIEFKEPLESNNQEENLKSLW
jgi:hypothetical protein